jgi:hypothetical protein
VADLSLDNMTLWETVWGDSSRQQDGGGVQHLRETFVPYRNGESELTIEYMRATPPEFSS